MNKEVILASSFAGEEKDVPFVRHKVEFTAEPVTCSVKPLRFDESLCVGCNRCASVCQVDIMIPNPEKGKPPVVLYPGECYYCGSCVMACPNPGAIKLQHPLMNQTRFVDTVSPEGV